jgi:hypothetical protein
MAVNVIAVPVICPIAVARPAPDIPIVGKGPIPKIRNGAITAFTTTVVISTTVGNIVFPVDREIVNM